MPYHTDWKKFFYEFFKRWFLMFAFIVGLVLAFVFPFAFPLMVYLSTIYDSQSDFSTSLLYFIVIAWIIDLIFWWILKAIYDEARRESRSYVAEE